LDTITNYYVVIGAIGNKTSATDKKTVNTKNAFGNIFSNAAESAKVRYKLDSFETSIIEIHKDDFNNFIEA